MPPRAGAEVAEERRRGRRNFTARTNREPDGVAGVEAEALASTKLAAASSAAVRVRGPPLAHVSSFHVATEASSSGTSEKVDRSHSATLAGMSGEREVHVALAPWGYLGQTFDIVEVHRAPEAERALPCNPHVGCLISRLKSP